MPTNYHQRVIALGLALVAGTQLANAQENSSRRTVVLHRLNEVEQTSSEQSASVAAPTAKPSVRPISTVAPAVHRSQNASQPGPSLVRLPQVKPTSNVGFVSQEAVKSEVEAKDFAPAKSAPTVELSTGAASNGGNVKQYAPPRNAAGPNNVSVDGHLLKARAEYRWQKAKYRWQHYWKPGLQEHHWGYPEEFCEKPLRFFVYSHMKTQVANGEAARMSLYHYDFVQGEARLNPRGYEQLAKIAMMLPQNYFPVIIEHSHDNPELAESRRKLVLDYLQKRGFPVPDQRIVVTTPIPRGYHSFEGQIVSETLVQGITTQGISTGYISTNLSSAGGSGGN